MKVKDNKGSITLFVLVGLLFMTMFLIISYGVNVNKSKIAKEQYNIISSIYSHNDGDENAYKRAYTAIRKRNAQELTATSAEQDDTSTLELTKTFDDTLSNYIIYGNSVQDTDTYGTPSPSNPVEIQSVGDKTKNLFKPLVKGIGLNFNTGTQNTNSSYASTDYIPVDFNTNPNYYLSGLVNNINSCVFAYNKDKVFLGRTGGMGRSYLSLTKDIFTSGTAQGEGDIAYLRISQYVVTSSTGTIDDIDNANTQLEIGTQATEYEPYGYKIPIKLTNENNESITTNIYLDEPLRKVGDAEDYIDFGTRKVIRKTQKVVFTGEENISANTTNNFYTDTLFESTSPRVNSTHFKGMDSFSIKADDTAGVHTTQSRIYFFPITGFDTNVAFKEWLADEYASGTPVTVYYKLVTLDDTQTIELPELQTFEDYTKIEVLTEVAPSKIEATYYGYTIE